MSRLILVIITALLTAINFGHDVIDNNEYNDYILERNSITTSISESASVSMGGVSSSEYQCKGSHSLNSQLDSSDKQLKNLDQATSTLINENPQQNGADKVNEHYKEDEEEYFPGDLYQEPESISSAPLIITASAAVDSTYSDQEQSASFDSNSIESTASLDSATNNERKPQQTLSLPTIVIPSTLGSSQGHNNSSDDNEDESIFLSFEEWRKLKLEKSGQSTENLDERGGPVAINNRLSHDQSHFNMIVDDNEIDIDMFQSHASLEEDDYGRQDKTQSGRVYKDRFNFASFDCAATIVKTNSGTKGASNILFDNKDSYLINECSEPDKFLIIELCQDILVDNVKIANYEFFSSMFRHIRISVSDSFPTSSWRIIGEFEAKSVRDLQSFTIKNPQIWARFLQVEVLSHYGNEFYCPISVIQVHGTTMMDEYRSHEQAATHHNNMRQKNSAGSTKSPSQIPVTNGGDVINSIEAPEKMTSEEKLESIFEFSNTVDFRVPEVPTSIFGAQPGESSISECPASSSEKSENEDTYHHYQENMSRPMVTSLISPLVLNESCNWDEYMHISSINSIFDLHDRIVENGDENSSINGGEFKTQDSIYQTIMKRLSLLESNASLSLRYIEEQSQSMKDLLSKIEKKQNNRIVTFFSEFNNTVVSQFQYFQEQYAKLLLNTIIESQSNQLRVNQDIEAMSFRMKILADELVYQKNMGIIQAIVLVTILLFVITTRGAPVDSYAIGNSSFARLWGGPSSVTSSVVGSPRSSIWARSRSSSPIDISYGDSPIEDSSFLSNFNDVHKSVEEAGNYGLVSRDENETVTKHRDFEADAYNDKNLDYGIWQSHGRSKSVEIARQDSNIS